ncbi:putative serine/threonine-protein kinase abkB [Porphyridium purpureum]|uniref:Putative serine/threonine-protein kinase abkB n=1 Tax=Porphyridium purpureum TaxID=35688 RepID=A0A5J4YM95_PORPP|nr:putative serine/threonine-protein kinase abkB [Porphyridium purpureum]|eukprot:POR6552..scf244_11
MGIKMWIVYAASALGIVVVSVFLFLCWLVGWRSVEVYAVALRVHCSYYVIRKLDKYGKGWLVSTQRIDAWWEHAHQVNAEYLYQRVANLQGLYVKFAQYVSSRSDIFPDAYIRSFARCQDTCKAKPFEETSATICAEFGIRSVYDMFDAFEPEPIASASIAQVYRAKYRGTDVAVKVQHRGVDAKILQDLAVMNRIADVLAWSVPEYDVRPVMREWGAEVPHELDFVRERDNLQRVERAAFPFRFQTPLNDPLSITCEFPQVILDVPPSQRVLVMTFIDGVRILDTDALSAHGVDMDWLLTQCARAFGCQVFIDGCFSGDPHPGNLMVRLLEEKGQCRPVLLDFGLTKILDDSARLGFAKMIVAADENDVGTLIDSFDELGLILSSSFHDLYAESVRMTRFFFRDSKPKEEARTELKSEMKDRKQRMKKMSEKIKIKLQGDSSLRRNPLEAFPGSFVFFSRMLYLLRGLATHLGVRVSYLHTLRPFAERALFEHARKMHAVATLRHQKIPRVLAPGALLPQLERRALFVIDKLHNAGLVQGCQVVMHYQGKRVLDVSYGVASKYSGLPVTPDTLFNVFSVTKAFATVLFWSLHDHGMLLGSIDTPLCDIWPGFGSTNSANENQIAVRHILSHSAGLARAGLESLMESPFEMLSWDTMLQHMQNATPSSKPGDVCEYHALSFGWLLGYVIEHMGGASFEKLLKTELAEPMGLESDMWCGFPADTNGQSAFPDVEHRLASLAMGKLVEAMRERFSKMSEKDQQRLKGLVRTEQNGTGADMRPEERMAKIQDHLDSIAPEDESSTPSSDNASFKPEAAGASAEGSSLTSTPSFFNYSKLRRACIPAANGHVTARAVAALMDVLANDGLCCSTGARILHPGTVRRIVESTPAEWDFGLGLRKHPGANNSKLRISHGGLGGSYAYADADARFALGVTVNALNPQPVLAAAMMQLASMQFSDVQVHRLDGADFIGSRHSQ